MRFLKGCGCLGGISMGLIVELVSGAAVALSADQPNVIFILTDDMGYGDFGAAGHPYVKTPHIDRLAREGTVFTDFYVNSGVCAPSRVAFMTGLFPARLNAHHIYHTKEHNLNHGVPDYLDPNLLTVADVMKQAGYTTGHIGKWHLKGRAGEAPLPEEYGFDFDSISHGAHASALYRARWKTTDHQVTASSHWIMEDGIDFIKQHKDDGKPFYLNLWTLVPHARLLPTEEELSVYDGLQTDPDDFSSWMRDYAADARDLTSQMKVYCASMTSLDAAIGKLLDYLDESGLAENTLIVFSSDNGPEDYHAGSAANAGVGSPGEFRGRKRSPYLGGMRVPMIVRWPGKTPAGIKNSAVWSAVDFLPTFAAITGVELSKNLNLDGENIAAVLTGGTQGRKAPLFWEWKFEIFGNQDYRPPQLAMLDGKWWAGCNPDGSRMELHDLSNDPAQIHNLSGLFPEVAERMGSELKAWKQTIPESYYVKTPAAPALPLAQRVGFEPASGLIKANESAGGTGVFGAAKPNERQVYLWFALPDKLNAARNDWVLDLVIRSQGGNSETPQPADNLIVDLIGTCATLECGADQLAAYHAASPLRSIKADYQGALLKADRFPPEGPIGHYAIRLGNFADGLSGNYLLLRLRDQSPIASHWSECGLNTVLTAEE